MDSAISIMRRMSVLQFSVQLTVCPRLSQVITSWNVIRHLNRNGLLHYLPLFFFFFSRIETTFPKIPPSIILLLNIISINESHYSEGTWRNNRNLKYFNRPNIQNSIHPIKENIFRNIPPDFTTAHYYSTNILTKTLIKLIIKFDGFEEFPRSLDRSLDRSKRLSGEEVSRGKKNGGTRGGSIRVDGWKRLLSGG